MESRVTEGSASWGWHTRLPAPEARTSSHLREEGEGWVPLSSQPVLQGACLPLCRSARGGWNEGSHGAHCLEDSNRPLRPGVSSSVCPSWPRPRPERGVPERRPVRARARPPLCTFALGLPTPLRGGEGSRCPSGTCCYFRHHHAV